ncbi:hypothetical protein AeNC1_003635 [Aphanomyces euteiches]|nr:hypothetical protein AeNC1_003635 [Aphanomyces euteiches]
MGGAKAKKQDKTTARKKVHAKPTVKKGQPFASLHKNKQGQQKSNSKQHAQHGHKTQTTKEQEARRKQKLLEQRNFEERMRAAKQQPQPKPAPAFIMAPATFTFPSATPAPTNPALTTFMDPLLKKDAPTVPSGPRIQPTIAAPSNVFAVLDDEEPAQTSFPMQPPTFQIQPPTFQIQPATFQLAPSTFQVQPASFQMPPPQQAGDDSDDPDL